MKRWFTRLVVFLLLGAIVNVAVAWGCALWSSVTQASGLPQQRVLALLQERQFFPQPGEHYEGSAEEGIGLTVFQFVLDPTSRGRTSDANQREAAWVVATLAGLPVRSLQAEWRGAGSDLAQLASSLRLIGGIELDDRIREQDLTFPYVLPLRPIWPGFAVNTVFYATLLWLFIFAAYALRRRARRKRGLCVACGYDLRHVEHDACPECGAVIGPAAGANG